MAGSNLLSKIPTCRFPALGMAGKLADFLPACGRQVRLLFAKLGAKPTQLNIHKQVAHNMKKLLVILIILTLNSCFMSKGNGIEMEIRNNSSEPITDVEITTSEKLEIIKIERIEPNESATKYLFMKKNKGDGSYSLTFTRANGKKEMSGGGYYTNGGSLDKGVDFIVENDTTIVKFEISNY